MYRSIMHVSFYCKHFDEMIDYYTNKLNGKIKSVVRYGEYVGVENRPLETAIGEKEPDRIYYVYVELAPGQFIELYPAKQEQEEHVEFNSHIGFSHFAILVDDIEETRRQMLESGAPVDTEISIGPSHTYQMWTHDPDDNRIEIMQFTENSYQVVGHNI